MPAYITLKGTRVKIPYKKLLQAKPKKSGNIELNGDNSESLKVYAPYAKTFFVQLLSRFMDIPEERSFRFNPLGAMVWEMCDGEHSIDEIKDVILKRSKGDEKDIEKRLIKFINRLAANNLITLEV
jgi:hypothetical protein